VITEVKQILKKKGLGKKKIFKRRPGGKRAGVNQGSGDERKAGGKKKRSPGGGSKKNHRKG